MIVLSLILALALAVYLFTRMPKFGRLPSGKRLSRIAASENYSKGQFHNRIATPDLSDGATYFKVIKKVLLERSKRSRPKIHIPGQKENLKSIEYFEDVVVWFGHSSYFLQLDGKKFLVDPVFSGAASPIRATTRGFAGSDIYTVHDIPEIDLLILTHDHWDHLDYETVTQLRPKIKQVICPLGVGEHLRRWGFQQDIVIERDWNESFAISDHFMVRTATARHFSGRGFRRNKSLWTSYILITPSWKIYLGGDSGYGPHFAEIGKTFGPFDLAVLECGQYDAYWKFIHMMPEETVKAARDLNANVLLPVHWGKFALANHAWDEPILRVTAAAEKEKVALMTPMLGEIVNLNETAIFGTWWEAVD
ncbi:MAG TPA: MBL fold metallo-hydrolase [Flavobacterium sp.]|jgi:L-ascorbate metabolism protein UlaG (beta-lactamase superfamily)